MTRTIMRIEPANAPIIAIDLCCGAGGWACAARGLAIRIVLAIDFWEPAATTYRLNHPETEVLCADVRDESVRQKILDLAKDRGVSLILGGIPCEWLSVYRHLQKVKIAEPTPIAARSIPASTW